MVSLTPMGVPVIMGGFARFQGSAAFLRRLNWGFQAKTAMGRPMIGMWRGHHFRICLHQNDTYSVKSKLDNGAELGLTLIVAAS